MVLTWSQSLQLGVLFRLGLRGLDYHWVFNCTGVNRRKPEAVRVKEKEFKCWVTRGKSNNNIEVCEDNAERALERELLNMNLRNPRQLYLNVLSVLNKAAGCTPRFCGVILTMFRGLTEVKQPSKISVFNRCVSFLFIILFIILWFLWFISMPSGCHWIQEVCVLVI